MEPHLKSKNSADASDPEINSSSTSSADILTSATGAEFSSSRSRPIEVGRGRVNSDRPKFSPPLSVSWRSSTLQKAARKSSGEPDDTGVNNSRQRVQRIDSQNTPAVTGSPGIAERSPVPEPPAPSSHFCRRRSLVDVFGVNSVPSVNADRERRRISVSSSLFSFGSSVLNSAWPPQHSTSSSMAGSEAGDGQPEDISNGSTTIMSPISVTTTGLSGLAGTSPSHVLSGMETSTSPELAGAMHSIASQMGPPSIPPRQSISRQSHSRVSSSKTLSGLNTTGTSSPGSDRSSNDGVFGTIGICALDAKARTKPCRNILNRINARNEFKVIIFGDKVILDETAENWPLCDYLISFFSDGFPLDKAIEYVRLRKPYSVNDLPMQMVLWDRRLCLQILDRFQVPTPARVEVTRDGGPRIPSTELAQSISKRAGIPVAGPDNGTSDSVPPPKEVIMVDSDTISVDGKELKKPFVEKPVSGEDHNIWIYYSSETGGGGRRLFRKINNKSSEADETLDIPRSITDQSGSYIYESFLSTQNHEDIKAYTVGRSFCHAETRKSPSVDGIVKRNTHGKEIRYVTSLTVEETIMASKISEAFGQFVCGFDLLRTDNKSYVIDVNGWSFVKDNNEYYDKCANLLRDLFMKEKYKQDRKSAVLDGDNNSLPDTELSGRQGTFSSLRSLLKSPSTTRQQSTSRAAAASPDWAGGPDLSISSPPSLENVPSIRLPSALQPLPSSLPASSANVEESITILDNTQDTTASVPPPASKAQWQLKGMVGVIRHADRTPKQKMKFTFHAKPFVDLLKGHREEVLLIGEAALGSVLEAVSEAQAQRLEDPGKLRLLRTCLLKKGSWAGTKVQIKPMFRKSGTTQKTSSNQDEGGLVQRGQVTNDTGDTASIANGDSGHLNVKEMQRRNNSLTDDVTLSRAAAEEENLELDKLQLIIKWGGEPTHSARYQSQELGEIFRNDLLLMNRESVENLKVFSSSERRSTTSAQIWTASFLNEQDVPSDFVAVRKDLLDDSNAAKDEMDKVKKKLKGLLRKGTKAPPQFAWPENMPEPYIVAQNVVELMKFHCKVMNENFARLNTGAASSLAAAIKNPGSASSNGAFSSTGGAAPAGNTVSVTQAIESIQPRWCCGEDADLFKERWEKLFEEFQDPEKVDPGRISELHDTIKFDALHNRAFLEWVFTPSQQLMDEFFPVSVTRASTPDPPEEALLKVPQRTDTVRSSVASDKLTERGNLVQRMGFKKRTVLDATELRRTASNPAAESYFSLYTGDVRSRAKTDVRLEKLRELFLFSKILFDFIGPQEYGITDAEKLEIGLLTSLPLLKAIVQDLEDMQASPGAKTRIYFTKESHIYTLLNCIIEGGIQTKIERNKIPELDYLSCICFELYESQNVTLIGQEDSFNYSIRITISPGCHTFEPLDVQLDSKHCIGFAQRRSLTAHIDWKTVIETLRAKFHTVNLPKSFIAVNLSEKVPQEFECTKGELAKTSLKEEQRNAGSNDGNGINTNES